MKRTLALAVLLAIAGSVDASPQVSGDGACGIRAVDNESFVSCDGDRAPGPVAPEGPLAAQFPPGMPITTAQARNLKRDLGERAIVVDLRDDAESYYNGTPIVADAQVPFIEAVPGPVHQVRLGEFEWRPNARFLEQMDRALLAAGLRHGDPVVIVCRAEICRREAPSLMREHGYEQVFVVTEAPEETLAGAPR